MTQLDLVIIIAIFDQINTLGVNPMLIEFAVENYRSIKERQVLSMVKAKGGELENSNSFPVASPANKSLLRSAAIYGANAAGKSNFIRAIRSMKALVLNSASASQEGDGIRVTPFLIDEATASEPTEFEILFINEGVRYQYGFCADKIRVIEEWLIAYPKGRAQRWYSRGYDKSTKSTEYKFGDQFTGQKTMWQNATRENALFLSTAIQLNNEQLRPVFNWFRKILRTSGFDGGGSGYTVSFIEQYDAKDQVLEFLRSADLTVHDIVFEKEKFDPEPLYKVFSENVMGVLIEELMDKEHITKIRTIHKRENGTLIPFDLEEESDGTQKFFSFAGSWLEALKYGKVLIVDELHAYLHPKIVQFLVNLFHDDKTNPNHAQLIFTSHEASILSQGNLRRDQIWFCEKQRDQATSLYPLLDFKPRWAREDVEQRYLSGRYGALPYTREFELEVS